MVRIHIRDAEHWITVHPNGNKEEKGTPLLIEGSNGHYVVKGGAGGKLNGRTVTPKSMSKARAGTENEGGNPPSGGQPAAGRGGSTPHTETTGGNKGEKPETGKPETPANPNAVQNMSVNDIETMLRKGGTKVSWIGEITQILKTDPELAPRKEAVGMGMSQHYWSRAQVAKAIEKFRAKNAESPETGKGETGEKPEANDPRGRNLSYEDCQLLLRNKRLDSEDIGKIMNLLNTRESQFEPHRNSQGHPHWSREQLGQAYREVMNGKASESEQQFEQAKAAKEEASRKADELSSKATTIEEHRAAMEAHYAAYKGWEAWKTSRRKEMNHHAASFHAHRKEVARLEKEAKKSQPRKKKEAVQGKSFAKSTPAEIQSHFESRWGLNFANGFDKKQIAALQNQYWNAETPEKKAEIKKKIESLSSHPAGRVRGFTPVDINGSGASAKLYREMLTHVDNSLLQMEASGFQVKEALSKAKVTYCAGSTGKSLGLAWGGGWLGDGNEGHFGVNAAALGKNREERASRERQRKIEGRGKWTVSCGTDDEIRATIVHEMAHALGIRKGVESPVRLGRTLETLFPNFNERRDWIKANISEYATTNIRETDAELASMVTNPQYKWGTLPKELEDHVKWLFNYKG